MAGILIYSDKNDYALELLTAARIITASSGLDVRALSINNDSQAEALAGAGAEVCKINNTAIALADASALANAIKQAVEKLDINTILLSSNLRGRELAGRLAQIIGTACLTGVSAVKLNGDKLECQRNALGGATVATQYIATEKKVIAIVPRSFEKAPAGTGKISELEVDVQATPGLKLVETKAKSEDSVDIEAAEVLVAVGQGLNSKDDLPMVEALVKALGGELACSKPVATDKKWLSEERIIGLSGKKCKPELAVLLGISGQVQFNVGIRDAGTIVAVNSDENAYVNKMADYVLVDDLHKVVAELNKILA
jgi:electron transfer flavoprotein alpha subunit